MMEDLSTERTPLLIAAEINTMKHQVSKVLLYNAIEIGSRLVEAKGLLPYGEWGRWLEESVSYSQKTAGNLIRLFEEYGPPQPASPDWQALAKLSYTQGLILLGIPEEERAQFIAELDQAYHKSKANKIAFLYESLDRNFRELLWELKEFAKQEPDTYKVYKDKIVNFLAEGLKAKM